MVIHSKAWIFGMSHVIDIQSFRLDNFTLVFVDIIVAINIHLAVGIHRHAYFTDVRINFARLKSAN